MLKLIVNPGTEQAWSIPLPIGITTLGSDPASLIPITNETVSAAHCEFQVMKTGVVIRDLGSAAGTFVNHAPVTETVLQPGQTVYLGEVAFQLVSELADGEVVGAPPLPPRLPGPVAADTATHSCKYHPRAVATWHCGHCQAFFCDLCVSVRGAGQGLRHTCRKCGVECAPVAVRYETPVAEDFFQSLPGAFSFPFVGNGVILLVAGTVFFAVLQFMSRHAGIVGLGLAVFTAGYLFSYLKQIVATTAQGSNDPPDWPDFGNMLEDIVEPFGQMIALILLMFGPAIVLALMKLHYRVAPQGLVGTAPAWLDEYGGLLIIADLAAGAALAPMGMLMLAMFDHVGALNPVALVMSISRIPLPYLAAAVAAELVAATYLAAGVLAQSLGAPAVLANLALGFLNLYCLSVCMRILGLLYRTNRDRLGWF